MVLNAVISKLAGKRVVLASASPRRREILNNVGLRFEVVPSWFKENLDKSAFKTPYDYAIETAKQKALEVATRMHLKHFKTPDIVIGADTVVCIHGDILEKPANKQVAYHMLSRLSNEEHSVFTGVAVVQCICKSDNQLETNFTVFYEETKVKFSELSEELLWEYIHSGEPMDKAGGYGIQALGGMLVEYVHGDFFNVVGFPLNHFCKKLDEICSLLESQSITSKTKPSELEGDSVNHKKKVDAEMSLKSNQTAQKEEELKGLGSILQNVTSKAQELVEMHHGFPRTSTHIEMNECLHKVADLVDGFKASKVLFTATKLKVFDILSIQDGLEASDIAQRLKTTVDGTERLLDACVSLGLLDKTSRTSQLYKNTKLANTFLVSGTANSMCDYILYNNDYIWPLFTHLDSAVKDGSNQCLSAPGEKPEDLFQNSAQMLSLTSALNSVVKVVGNDIVRAFDLSSFKTACDLGGATGALAYEMADTYQDMVLTVFNLPQLLEKFKCFQQQNQNPSRISFRGGDIFTDDIPEAELYILVNGLHYWKEDKVNLLLSRLSQICKPGCGLLLTELVLHNQKTKPCTALLQSLSVMMQSEGKERSGSEYRKLLNKHGFINVQIKHMGTFLDAIFCRKQ
ncbi:probable bifunctional dTTP/UTP pyrophosphatase/methyltransferase protein [Pristis pectinata]|uniref:probable bifunctional dTTP/UTP pyrophosphatase/methyltransferase protein n=1 Tax=Pristis pectinata TaxID=685728 RepID=UPI00223E29D6|nr:probable bifunctional dTTP/UTP pyrophosphatase/methyltransferase protein [Pristis pectinata]XP_051881905.1 probable bifunctional dTTP/UTP pyrophosphatase/methyltransferase protein [Pristis pectinata]